MVAFHCGTPLRATSGQIPLGVTCRWIDRSYCISTFDLTYWCFRVEVLMNWGFRLTGKSPLLEFKFQIPFFEWLTGGRKWWTFSLTYNCFSPHTPHLSPHYHLLYLSLHKKNPPPSHSLPPFPSYRSLLEANLFTTLLSCRPAWTWVRPSELQFHVLHQVHHSLPSNFLSFHFIPLLWRLKPPLVFGKTLT